MHYRIAGVFGLQGQVEGLPQVLGQKAKGVGALQRRRGVEVLEDEISGGPELVTERLPRATKVAIVSPVTESHRLAHPTRSQDRFRVVCGPAHRGQGALRIDTRPDDLNIEDAGITVGQDGLDESLERHRPVTRHGTPG